jgi:hypothetical protein
MKVTVPPGLVPDTCAVRVTALPRGALAVDVLSVTVVGAASIVALETPEVLPA